MACSGGVLFGGNNFLTYTPWLFRVFVLGFLWSLLQRILFVLYVTNTEAVHRPALYSDLVLSVGRIEAGSLNWLWLCTGFLSYTENTEMDNSVSQSGFSILNRVYGSTFSNLAMFRPIKTLGIDLPFSIFW